MTTRCTYCLSTRFLTNAFRFLQAFVLPAVCNADNGKAKEPQAREIVPAWGSFWYRDIPKSEPEKGGQRDGIQDF